VFCRITTGTAHAFRLYEDQIAVAFSTPHHPVREGTPLVPRRHVCDVLAAGSTRPLLAGPRHSSGRTPITVNSSSKARPPVPSAFVYARHDEVFTTEGMVWAARQVFGVEPIEIETGHTPQLEAPNDLADLLERLARLQGHVVARPGA
jgi:pimeloyl-ACP methyl ester carboxylesterase